MTEKLIGEEKGNIDRQSCDVFFIYKFFKEMTFLIATMIFYIQWLKNSFKWRGVLNKI